MKTLIAKVPRSFMSRMSWIAAGQVVNSVVRFATNVILTHLLSPSLMGIMAIINVLRTGIELMTDVGVGQNVVNSKRGFDPAFFNTAWTIQVIRGLILAILCILLSIPLSWILGKPEVATLMPFSGIFSLLSGFSSVGLFLVQKRIDVARYTKFDICQLIASLIVYSFLALISPTIWALIIGTVIGFGFYAVTSYLMVPGLRQRFMWDADCAREVLVFGRWIFLSSLIGFLALNFDRLYFAKALTLAQIGIYGIARSISEIITNIAVRYGGMLVFPLAAEMMAGSATEVHGRLRPGRLAVLLAAAVGLAGITSVADKLIYTIYDPRYHEAGTMLAILLLGVWIAVLSTINEYILLGVSRPQLPAIANGVKLLVYIVATPAALIYLGFEYAIVAMSAGELVRYLTLWIASRRFHLAFGRDDLLLTAVFVVAVIMFREFFCFVGLTGSLHALFPVVGSLARHFHLG